MFAGVHKGMSMYTGSHCVALGHNLVGLWFLSLHRDFFIAHRGVCWGACWWVVHGGVHRGFFGVSYGCGFWLFTGPPSILDYALSYLFSFN